MCYLFVMLLKPDMFTDLESNFCGKKMRFVAVILQNAIMLTEK